ncbi:Uncharacterised protein [Mycobacteroides abscessus subsp. abscessus]|uniref:hypothetical protein n=1 Tax=Mycobacteroides abscessus TaxID=36809 RepID=UPI00092ABF31|nr:hypothetical protein [Mycobacteroides abscessus]SIC55131.1 Uncharacterised protein [Mycobacteroides abscessus subsp. abscessus]SKU58469.1 Uncharacterised protein [Mycobacteroides abscessus subsp. abscessus]
MSRTDRRGRDLKLFLQAEIVNANMQVGDVVKAVGVTTSRYYGDSRSTGRKDSDDFPNADELRHIADHYNLGDEGYFNLLVEFGHAEPQPGFPGFTGGAESAPKAQGRTTTKTRPRRTPAHQDVYHPSTDAP